MVIINSSVQRTAQLPRRERHPQGFVEAELFSHLNGLSLLRGLKRTSWDELTFDRILRGGRVSDLGRTWRYSLILGAGIAAAWLPSLIYIKYGAVHYTSHFSLILPGAGSNSSVNISEIGQATSTASSPFSSSSISPTVTYKNLIMSANVLNAAAQALKIHSEELSTPKVKLIDETSLITVDMNGASPDDARNRAKAIQDSFFSELDKLRNDELKRREDSTLSTIKEYEVQVESVRQKINQLQVQSGLNSTEQYNTIIGASETLRAKISETESNLARVENSAQSLENNLDITPSKAIASMKLHADPEFISLADATAKKESEFAEAAQQFGANHPKLVDARVKFIGARNKMLARASIITGMSSKALIGNVDFSPVGQRSGLMIQLVNLETDRQGLKAQLHEMRAQLNKNQEYVASLATVVSKLNMLDRDYKLAEAVFTSALGRITTSKSDIFASYPLAQVAEAAIMPLSPSAPNRNVALAGSAAASAFLLIACLLAWLRRPLVDKLLRKIHKSNDAKNTS